METIKRKTLLYKTGVGGMDYCLNHVLGCSHGCRYPCYAFSMKKSYGQVASYDAWCEPKIVSNALELLDKEILKLKNKIKTVHLCFATDPFMYGYPEIVGLSLKIIEKLNANDIPCSTLTKSVTPQELGGKDRFSQENEYGMSIVSLSEDFRKKWEPGSAPYLERIESLKYLSDKGFYTWAHIEPYPTPNIFKQDVAKILEKISFVRSISFEGWNYNPLVRQYKDFKQFYFEQEKIVADFCKVNRISCHT
jgi:DNA repair photolyase